LAGEFKEVTPTLTSEKDIIIYPIKNIIKKHYLNHIGEIWWKIFGGEIWWRNLVEKFGGEIWWRIFGGEYLVENIWWSTI
jgi:hypothetical protein